MAPFVNYLSLWRGDILVPAHPSPRFIVAQVAEAHGFTLEELKGPSRRKKLVRARWAAMAELRLRTRLSTPQIAHQVGRSDHTTVLHGLKRHAEQERAG